MSAPDGGWVRRDGDYVSVGCDGVRRSWHLTCNGTDWIGEFGNCDITGSSSGRWHLHQTPFSILTLCPLRAAETFQQCSGDLTFPFPSPSFPSPLPSFPFHSPPIPSPSFSLPSPPSSFPPHFPFSSPNPARGLRRFKLPQRGPPQTHFDAFTVLEMHLVCRELALLHQVTCIHSSP